MPSHSRFALLPLALSGALLAGAVYAQQQAAPPVTDEQLRAAFNTADANRDGNIDIDEAVGDAIFVFARYDTNRDGFLVIAELPRHNPERFKRADRDGDGRLSVGEVAAERVYEFFLMDTNRNGVVTFEEVRAYADTVRNAKK
jgi:Ca2+-binding EF-hand superfamily protein